MVTELPDELILLLPAYGKLFSLNATGAFLWGLLDCEAATLAEKLTERFLIPLEQTRQDVATFVAELSARQLVQVVSR
jgi:coenzyme PQQ synthesis protein D (PqqD)